MIDHSFNLLFFLHQNFRITHPHKNLTICLLVSINKQCILLLHSFNFCSVLLSQLCNKLAIRNFQWLKKFWDFFCFRFWFLFKFIFLLFMTIIYHSILLDGRSLILYIHIFIFKRIIFFLFFNVFLFNFWKLVLLLLRLQLILQFLAFQKMMILIVILMNSIKHEKLIYRYVVLMCFICEHFVIFESWFLSSTLVIHTASNFSLILNSLFKFEDQKIDEVLAVLKQIFK